MTKAEKEALWAQDRLFQQLALVDTNAAAAVLAAANPSAALARALYNLQLPAATANATSSLAGGLAAAALGARQLGGGLSHGAAEMMSHHDHMGLHRAMSTSALGYVHASPAAHLGGRGLAGGMGVGGTALSLGNAATAAAAAAAVAAAHGAHQHQQHLQHPALIGLVNDAPAVGPGALAQHGSLGGGLGGLPGLAGDAPAWQSSALLMQSGLIAQQQQGSRSNLAGFAAPLAQQQQQQGVVLSPFQIAQEYTNAAASMQQQVHQMQQQVQHQVQQQPYGSAPLMISQRSGGLPPQPQPSPSQLCLAGLVQSDMQQQLIGCASGSPTSAGNNLPLLLSHPPLSSSGSGVGGSIWSNGAASFNGSGLDMGLAAALGAAAQHARSSEVQQQQHHHQQAGEPQLPVGLMQDFLSQMSSGSGSAWSNY